MPKKSPKPLTVYICGDSFSVSDPEYGPNWADLFVSQTKNCNVTNLALPGASNYLIYLQVKEALANNCDYLIYHATSSVRQEFTTSEDHCITDHVNRYYNSADQNSTGSMICGSWHDIGRHYKSKLSNNSINEIARFSAQYIDLPSSIEKNYIYIRYTLGLISDAKLKSWAWSRGGFEHPSFSKSSNWDFSRYTVNEARINLWDNADTKLPRPIYHVIDQTVHQNVCNQYIEMLKL